LRKALRDSTIVALMSGNVLENILGTLYVLVGPVAWLLFAFVMVKGRKRMQIMVRPAPALPQPPPKVSILLPAKDEAGQIEQCVRSILSQDYPNFELVVVDDRSTDGTGEILDRMAREDARVRAVHLTHTALPPGWGGKSYALHGGLPHADGKWLLFVDADVELQPDVLSGALAIATARQFDLLSLLPRFVGDTFWEQLLQPLAGAATSAMFLIALTNTNASSVAFANGQFLLVRKDVYDAIGGHEAIRGTLSEDVALARKLKSAGYRPRLSWADDWATVRMYPSFSSIYRGWGRNFFVGSLGKPWRILAAIAFVLCCCFSAYAAIAWGIYRNANPIDAWGGWGWIITGVAHLVIMTSVLAVMYYWSRNPWWNALLFPLGATVLLAIFAKSLMICATGRVEWRGTSYSRDSLPQGAPNA